MNAYFWIAIGSALGGMARYGCSEWVGQRVGGTFPWGTLFVNVTGSFLIGGLAAMSGPDGRAYLSPLARQFLMVGLLGGYTTFSAFSLQTLNLLRDGEWAHAGANVLLSVVACLCAVWLGYVLVAVVNQLHGKA